MTEPLPPEPLPPGGPFNEWSPTGIAALFLVIGALLGAVLYWGADQLLMDDDAPATNVDTATTTTTPTTITASTLPATAPTTQAQPTRTQPTAAPSNDGAAAATEADRRAQSDLRNAFTAARSIATDYEGRFQKNDAGDPIDPAALEAENPSLNYAPSGGAAVGVVSVAVESADGPNSHIWLITRSSTGRFYCVGGTSTGEVSRTTGTSEPAAKASCHSGANAW